MALDFGVIKTRAKVSQVEKYDFPVLTIMPKVDELGHVQKFDFNKAAVAAMNFDMTKECFIGLAFNEEKQLVLVNLGNDQAKVYAKLNRDYTFNSKRIYDILQKNLGFSATKTHEYSLDISPDESGYTFASLVYEIVPEVQERVLLNNIPSEEDRMNEFMEAEYAQQIADNNLFANAEMLN